LVVQPERIKKLLDNTDVSASSKTSISEKTEGMKYLLAVSFTTEYDMAITHPAVRRWRASSGCSPTSQCFPSSSVSPFIVWLGLQMMAKGRDVTEFYPDVVRNVIVKAVEVKKLVYSYLVHHAVRAVQCLPRL
jgi:hypothetical protein